MNGIRQGISSGSEKSTLIAGGGSGIRIFADKKQRKVGIQQFSWKPRAIREGTEGTEIQELWVFRERGDICVELNARDAKGIQVTHLRDWN